MTPERRYVTDDLAKTGEAIEAVWAQQRAHEAEREATLARLRDRCGLDALPPKDWTWQDRMRGRKRPLTLAERLAEAEADRGR